MGIDPTAILAVISQQALQIAALEQENQKLRDAIARSMHDSEK